MIQRNSKQISVPGPANPLFGGSIPPRASNLFIEDSREILYKAGPVDVPVTLVDRTSYTSIKFTYKGRSHTTRLYVPFAQLSGNDISTAVDKFIGEIDGLVDLDTLLQYYLEHGTGCYETRRKNVSNFKDYCQRDGIELTSSIKILSQTDEFGRSLPERWEAVFNLPHKLRQVRSIFGRKNIRLFKQKGWDTKVFGNFISFIPETTVTQPFSTSDNEVDHIIGFFNEAKDKHPIFYDIYLLAFGCGLRKKEIYQARYDDFTIFNGQCFLLLPFATKGTKLKGLNGHVEKAPVARHVYDYFTSRELTGNIVNGGERLHRRFVKFLKEEVGIKENKAAHRLRKILGARLATEHGIYHAAKQLRNSVQVAERYYSDLTAHRNELAV